MALKRALIRIRLHHIEARCFIFMTKNLELSVPGFLTDLDCVEGQPVGQDVT